MSKSEIFTMVFPEDAPCGCESGKAFGDCHLQDGQVKIAYKNINPTGSPTFKSVKKCYFAFTNNCDGGISKEHIISRAVLKEITDKLITIEKDGMSRIVSIDSSSLTTKRMCRRHNSAVNGLDREAGRFIRAIRRVDSVLGNEIKSKQIICFFHGFDIERWLLKTLLNIYHSGLSANRTKFQLPPDILQKFSYSFRSPYGLYLPVRDTQKDDLLEIKIKQNASFHLMSEDDKIIGVSVTLAGVEIKLIIAGTLPYTLEFQRTHVFRPKTINFFQDKEVMSILNVWIDGSPYDVWISRGDKTANHPTGIGGLIAEHLKPINQNC